MYSIELNFLTDNEEIKEVCRLYWELDENQKFKFSISNLARKFGYKANQLSKFVSDHCIAYTLDNECITCGAPYTFTNRTNLTNSRRLLDTDWKCSECVEKERLKRIEAQKQIEEQKRLIVRDTFSLSNREAIDLRSISLEHAVFLLALTRLGASEDLSYIRPIASASQLLAPSEGYGYEITHQMYQNGLIYIHPESDPQAFTFEGIKIVRYSTGYVMWALPKHKEQLGPQQIIFELEEIFRSMDWAENWHKAWPSLWKKIALEECLQYLNVCIEEHGFAFNPGDKTKLVIKGALANFSVSQVYNMTWRAAKDAAAFYMRERVSKKQAANTIVGSIQRYAERALAEGWEVKKYGRDRRCPQSLVSQILFNVVLQIGDDGFNEPPPSNSS